MIGRAVRRRTAGGRGRGERNRRGHRCHSLDHLDQQQLPIFHVEVREGGWPVVSVVPVVFVALVDYCCCCRPDPELPSLRLVPYKALGPFGISAPTTEGGAGQKGQQKKNLREQAGRMLALRARQFTGMATHTGKGDVRS
jgi:hypothetical protein